MKVIQVKPVLNETPGPSKSPIEDSTYDENVTLNDIG